MLRRADVDRLRRDDVAFELRCRGKPSEGLLQETRSRLRKALDEQISPSFIYFEHSELDSEISSAIKMLDLLSSDCYDLTDTVGNDYLRFEARFNSLAGRLNILKLLVESIPDPEGLIKVESLIDKLEDLKGGLSKLNLCSKESLSEVVPASSKTNSDSFRADVVYISQDGGNPPILNNENNLLDLGLKPLEASASAPVQVTSLGCRESVKTHESVYAKLPHPAAKLLAGLSKTDGFDVDILLKFLKTCINVRNSFPSLCMDFLTLLIPYTSGPLHDCLLRHIVTNDFNSFHRETLNLFIPVRQFQSLKTNLFLRCQSVGEPLASFIISVKEAAQVLLLDVTEKDVVNNIIEGLNPEVRSCLVFSSRPSTYAELDRLCVEVMNVQFTDAQRGVHASNIRPPIRFASPNVKRSVICHFCKEAGHIRPMCPKFKAFNNSSPRAEHLNKNKFSPSGTSSSKN